MYLTKIEIYVPPEARECQQCGRRVGKYEAIFTDDSGYVWCEDCADGVTRPGDAWED